MHLLVFFLCVVVAYAFPAREDSFPVRFVDFEGEYLSDPRERKLVASKLGHLWPIEDYWNSRGFGGVCEHAKEKQDPSVLKWYLEKGLQKACNRENVPSYGFTLIFRTILEFHDNEIIRVLFPIAKQLMDHCAFAASDLHLYPPPLMDRWQAWMDALDNSGPLPEFDDTAAKKQSHVSAMVAEEAYRKILDALDAEEKYTYTWNDQVLGYLEFISSADDNLSMIEDIARKIDDQQLCKASWSRCSKIFSRTESWLNKLQDEIVFCTDDLAPCSFSFSIQRYYAAFPADKHPRYAHIARLTLDMVNVKSKGKQWNTEYLGLLMTSGILKEFMSDESDYQLLEPGLKGPAWERIEPALTAEFVAKNELWLLQNFDEFTALDVSFVRELCNNFSGVLLEYLVSLAIKRVSGTVDYTLSLLESVDNADKVRLSNFLFRHPNIGRIVFDDLLYLKSFKLSGGAKVSFDLFTRSLLSMDDRRISSREVVKKLIAERDQIIGSYTIDDTNLENADVQFVHGRTAYLTEQGKAIKIEKKGKRELGDEMRMDLFFQRHHAELQLTSDLPQNPILLKRVKLDQGLADKLAPENAEYKLHEDVGFYRGLEFDVPEGYNIPLHRVESMQELESASAKSLGDAAILAKRFGLVSVAPADLFHNLEENRRYIWNIDFMLQEMTGYGAGRLDQWRKSIRHVNMGLSGIRDLKHFKFIDELKWGKTSFDRVYAILTNIGNFLLSWMLSVGEWFMTRGFDQTELQSVLKHGLSTFMAKFTDKPMEECTEFVTGALRLDRLARQMKYFMAKEYVNDLAHQIKTPIQGLKKFFTTKKYILGPYIESKIPRDIYGEDMKSISGHKPSQFWNEKEGWMRHEGEEDLGPYNGPFPITEMIRTLHIVLTTTLNLE